MLGFSSFASTSFCIFAYIVAAEQNSDKNYFYYQQHRGLNPISGTQGLSTLINVCNKLSQEHQQLASALRTSQIRQKKLEEYEGL